MLSSSLFGLGTYNVNAGVMVKLIEIYHQSDEAEITSVYEMTFILFLVGFTLDMIR